MIIVDSGIAGLILSSSIVRQMNMHFKRRLVLFAFPSEVRVKALARSPVQSFESTWILAKICALLKDFIEACRSFEANGVVTNSPNCSGLGVVTSRK